MTMLRWLYVGALLLAFALVLAGLVSRSRRLQRVERAADCAALGILMSFSKAFGWTWLAGAGAALGICSVGAMVYFFRRKATRR